jgi:hypothetical protein
MDPDGGIVRGVVERLHRLGGRCRLHDGSRPARPARSIARGAPGERRTGQHRDRQATPEPAASEPMLHQLHALIIPAPIRRTAPSRSLHSIFTTRRVSLRA